MSIPIGGRPATMAGKDLFSIKDGTSAKKGKTSLFLSFEYRMII